MKKIKKALSIVLIFALLVSSMQTVFAESSKSNTDAFISVEDTNGTPGSTVDVDIKIENNPGVLGAILTLSYDPSLTLVDAKSGDAFSALVMTKPGKFASPCKFIWDGQSISAADIKDGNILTLSFVISEEVQSGENLDVNISYEEGDFVDDNLQPIELEVNSGHISVVNFTPGDLNEDGKVNTTDVVLLRRYIAGGYGVNIIEAAADFSGDGKLNTTDVVLLRRYIAGGYGVVFPSLVHCKHTMEYMKAKDASCLASGNIEYWHCTKCDNYYSDENGINEISVEKTVIDAKGHILVVDPAVEPTYTSTGLTEGSHCEVCKKVLIAQKEIPVLQKNEYSITYYMYNNDEYLQQVGVENKNPTVYTSEDGLKLANISTPGYVFEGWYDGPGSNATLVKEIKKGENGNIELYARWSKETYVISFASDMVPIDDIQFTIDQEVELPTPRLDKYTFVGWSDKEGEIWNNIPVGTTGNILLYANWSSNRNKATAVKKLSDPIICEDSEAGLILFTYEIGTIENVPLFTTLRLNCVNGIISEHSKTETDTISTTQAETIAKTISNATTNSSSWTLSNNWNNTTEVSQSYLDQTGQERQEAETLAKSETGTYNLARSLGISNGNTKTSSGSFKLSGNQSHSDTTTTETGQNFDLSVDGKYSSEKSAGLSLGIPIEGINLGIEAGRKSGFEIGAGVDYGNYIKNTETGTDSWSNSIEVAGEKSNTKTDEKSWNSSIGYSNSKTTSTSSTVANTISKLISETYGYGKSYSEGGSNSEAQALASTDTESDEYSTTMTYYTSKIESTTTTYSSTGNTVGDYRLVMAGKIHVFAVVGYDVAEKTYFVYTYNVLDDETEEYLDYSYDGTFNDYETSIIPFEVPSFVNEYVNNRIAQTSGLRIDPDTGVIVNYTPSTDVKETIITIPSYVSIDNGDGTYKSIKVTGISTDLFKGNTNIVGVSLGRFITEIPDSAFEGCSSLKYVICPGVTKIGNNAFSGCTSLNEFTVPSDMSFIGSNTFEGVPKIKATASNADIAQAIADSGANNILLDISAIPEEQSSNMDINVGNISTFELQGKDKEYNGLSVKSNASTTIINGVKIVNITKTPLELSSENVTLNRVSINSTGYSMFLTSDNTNITLNGNVKLMSEKGKTVVSKNINLEPLSDTVVGKMHIAGKVLICGSINGQEYVEYDEIEYIDEDTYEKYKKGIINITLDANGGVVSTTNTIAYYGSAIGELPIPTRDYYTFDGWFTDIEGGTAVTSETVFSTTDDITIYAHWSEKPVSDWVLVDEMPEGAEVISEKWTYDEKSYLTTTDTSVAGYTQYNSYWEKSGSGSFNYASFPSGYNTSDSYYTSFKKSPYTEYENATTKRTVSKSWAGYIYWHWMYNCDGATAYYRAIYNKSGYCPVNGFGYYNWGAFASSTSYTAGSGYCNNLGWTVYYNTGRTSYASSQGSYYWFRFDYYKCSYTDYVKYFQYYKITAKESTTEVSATNDISNVQKWVQYREK